jgi:hypothetical protein
MRNGQLLHYVEGLYYTKAFRFSDSLHGLQTYGFRVSLRSLRIPIS